MKIVYLNKSYAQFDQMKISERNFIALFWDKWDDFQQKTQFPCKIVVNGERIEFDVNIKILIEGTDFSGDYLNKKMAEGWDGNFPIPNENYISVPSDIDFYGVLISQFGLEKAINAVLQLRDASYLHNFTNEPNITHLRDSAPFSDSLLRESGATKAFRDGWMAFDPAKRSTIEDFELTLPSDNGNTWTIQFRFNSVILPYDINVIIGPNGIGKSHCLKSLVEYWLKIGQGSRDSLIESGHTPFDQHPNLERLILLSYSPFEEFVLDLEGTDLQNKEVYKYFGFRRRGEDESGEPGIKISRNLPAFDSVNSIIECLQEDAEYSFLPNRSPKVETAIQVLKEAIDFDEMAIALKKEINPKMLFTRSWFVETPIKEHILVDKETNYLKVSKPLLAHITIDQLIHVADAIKGVVFVKNGSLIELSSGQRLFSYIVINVLGAIRNNSLIVIDEPELFLHPNLEITLIFLLKDVLRRFASKAIIATHSLVTVREIPANCVHVLRKSDVGRDVVRPPFETFGCDVQRISSYVFGDRSVSKPFETWLASKVKEYGNSENFIQALGTELNEEMLLRINYEGRRQ